MEFTTTEPTAYRTEVWSYFDHHPDLLKNIVREILLEEKVIVNDEMAARRRRVESLIDSHFEEFSEVFKALA